MTEQSNAIVSKVWGMCNPLRDDGVSDGDYLEQLLGRPVDLVNPSYIRNPYFLQAVNQSRTVVYDRQSSQTAV